MADEFERQLIERHDLVAHDVGDRHLRGGNQVELAFLPARHGEQVLLELGQLPGAAHARRIHQVRRIDLGVAMLARMHVEHELGKRTVQARERPGHERKARAADLGGGGEIEHPQRLADIDVILHRKIELPRRAVAAHFGIVFRRSPRRHAGVRQVRNQQQEVLQLRLDLQQLRLQRLQLGVGLAGLVHQRRDIFALALRLADALGQAVARGLQFLGARLHQLALLLQGLERRAVEMKWSCREPGRDAFEIVAQRLNV